MTVQKLVLFDFNADDPTSLVIGCVSMLIVLAALYRGGWRYVTHFAVMGLAMAVFLAYVLGGIAAAVYFLYALFGQVEGRGVNFLRGISIVAAMLVGHRVMAGDNVFNRFIAKLVIPGRLPR